MEKINLVDIKGIKIGHAHDEKACTGCSVVICEEGGWGGVDVRGGAPGTRETDLLAPDKMVEKIHAILLSGGSAFGLDAASGIMKYLEEQDVGFKAGKTKVPIVPSAVLFDLDIGFSEIRPNKEMGYKASRLASTKPSARGNIGAGMGATIGKYLGPDRAMKGGLGICAYRSGELKVGALVVVNCLGDVIDPDNGRFLAGMRGDNQFSTTSEVMINDYKNKENLFKGNTTLGVVVTNAKLSKVEANKLAATAHNGFAKTITPAHTSFDGDTIFALATGKIEASVEVVNIMAVKAVAGAVVDGIKQAETSHGYKSFQE